MVLDLVDASWDVPLAPRERKSFVGLYRGKFYVYFRAAQGSRNGLAWAGVISSAMRLSQSVCGEPRKSRTRINTHVDDQ